jgi:glutamate synthase (NADPH/NADH) large chain
MAANACEARAETKPATVHTFGLPAKQGLYDPRNEHDACGVGFIAHMKGEKSHQIVRDGLFMLENLTHRGAVGADPLMGDGAGMLVQIPDAFSAKKWPAGRDAARRANMRSAFLHAAGRDAARASQGDHRRGGRREGQVLLGFRDVPVDNSSCPRRRKSPPPSLPRPGVHRRRRGSDGPASFERRLFVLRKVISNRIYGETDGRDNGFYFVSLSTRRSSTRACSWPTRSAPITDLKDERFESALALVHQRFSTNTFPSWKLAHPYRMVAHNGEINTLRGNVNWMAARQASVSSRCSAKTSPSSGRSPMKASPTPPASTMRSSS